MEFNSLVKTFGLPRDSVAAMTWGSLPRQVQLLEMIHLEHRMAGRYTLSGGCVSGAEMLMKVSLKKFVGAAIRGCVEIVWVHMRTIANC